MRVLAGRSRLMGRPHMKREHPTDCLPTCHTNVVLALEACCLCALGSHTSLPCVQCHTNVVPVFEELDPQPTFFPPSPSPSTVSGLLGSAAAALAGDTPNGSADAGAAGAAAAEATEAGVADNVAAAAAAGGLHYTPLPLGASAGQRSLKSEKLEGMRRVVVLAVAVTGLLYSCVGEFWPGRPGLLWHRRRWCPSCVHAACQRRISSLPSSPLTCCWPFVGSGARGFSTAAPLEARKATGLSARQSSCGLRPSAFLLSRLQAWRGTWPSQLRLAPTSC